MSIPFFRRVACKEAIFKSVDPGDRSIRNSRNRGIRNQTGFRDPCFLQRGTIAAMAFARWDPIRDLLAIQQRLDRFAPGPAGWTPPVDLLETSDAYIVIAELPGVSREDLTISLHDDGRLTVAGV